MKRQAKQLLVLCAATALSAGAGTMTYGAVGWVQEGGDWRYYTADGDAVTEDWKKSGDHWFWLDEDGAIARDALIEDGEHYYYVNGDGAMVKNEWRHLDVEDADDGEPDTAWYYFGANGRAFQAPDSGKTTFKTIKCADGVSRKYAFDGEGRMLCGWVNESSERMTEDDGWKEAVYYLGEEGDGAQRANQWQRLELDEDEEHQNDDFAGYYWFYFGANGKKVADKTRTINGRKYRFLESGAAVFNWHQTASSDTASASNIYYNQPEQCWQANGWFLSVPDQDVDPEGYEDGEEVWFYALKDGDVVKNQIKKINGHYYGFDEYGKMLHGLYKMSVNDKEIQSYEKIETESDLPEEDDGCEVYYFGDSPKEGVMATGKATLEVDGEKYTYGFGKSGDERGQGLCGISDGSIYRKGRLMKADRDARLEEVSFEGNRYLVNTSGKIQKNKKNVRDADDMYYCTDAEGIVTYKGSEKWTDDEK